MAHLKKRISRPAPRPTSVATACELLTCVRELDGGAEAVVRRAGLAAPAAMLLDPTWTGSLTREEFARLYAECTWALDAHAAAQEGRAPLTKPEFDMLCYCVITSPTLREAVVRSARFGAMLAPRTAKLVLTVADGVAELQMPTIRTRRNVAAFVSDLTGLASHRRLFGWLIGEDLPLLEVALKYPPLLSDEAAARLMPHPITYRARENALRFPAEYLDRAVVRTSAELDRILEQFPFDLDEPQAKASTLTERVALVLGAALAQGLPLPTGAELAAQFSLSRATLTRHLIDEGTSLGRLKDDCRRDLAEQLLSQGRASIAEISGRLGYSDPANFSRAFKAWNGVSPMQWARASQFRQPAQ